MINSYNLTLPADICKVTGKYSAECLNKWFCPQISQYVVNTGIALVIAVVVASWGLWWFMTRGYKLINYNRSEWIGGGWALKFFGDFRNLEIRHFWVDFVKDREIKILVGFVIIIIFFYKKW